MHLCTYFAADCGTMLLGEAPAPHPLCATPDCCADDELRLVRDALRRITTSRIHNIYDAEDLVQETLLTMTVKLPGIQIEKGLLFWGIGILRKKLGNYYRQSRRFSSLEQEQATPQFAVRYETVVPSAESEMRHSEMSRVVEETVCRLPLRERQAIQLFMSGMQIREIVDHLQPERYQTIVNRLHRARTKLARELARKGYFPPRRRRSREQRVG